MTWQQELRRMKLDSIKASTPNAFEASGGYDYIIKPYIDTTSNGLTRCIIDFLTFKGHYANRINTQGQARVHKIPRFNIFTGKVGSIGEKVTWTKSTTKLGTPDIMATINGKSVGIELKVGKDVWKKNQQKQAADIERSGGLYFLARDMQGFVDWYYETFKV